MVTYNTIEIPLNTPGLRSNMEKKITEVGNGLRNKTEALDEIKALMRNIYKKTYYNIMEMKNIMRDFNQQNVNLIYN